MGQSCTSPNLLTMAPEPSTGLAPMCPAQASWSFVKTASGCRTAYSTAVSFAIQDGAWQPEGLASRAFKAP